MSELVNAKIGDIITLNNKKYRLIESNVRSKFGYNDDKVYELHFLLTEVGDIIE